MCPALCIECSDGRSAEQKRAQLEELAACTEAFGGAMDKCRERFAGKQRLSISAPLPARIIGKLLLMIFMVFFLFIES